MLIKVRKNNILSYLPRNFPVSKYEKVRTAIVTKKKLYELQALQFSGGWRAIIYRYLSCIEYSKSFTDLVKKYGNSPPQPIRYYQEKELFNFFISGLSVFDCFGYSIFMICSIIDPNNFPVQKNSLRDITLKRTVSELSGCLSSEKLTIALDALFHSQEFIVWSEVRNILIHRETPGRIIRMGTGSAKTERSDLWFKGTAIDKQTTVCRLNWLELNLFKLIELTYDFTNKLI